MVLLISSGLLVRSFSKLASVGFSPTGLYLATIRFPRPLFADSIRARAIIADIEQRARSLPNVIAVDFYETGDLFRVVDTLNHVPSTR